jgi:hypothetical protein
MSLANATSAALCAPDVATEDIEDIDPIHIDDAEPPW